MSDFDVIIIGGGASGLMLANKLNNSTLKVLLIEHNEKLGKKIYITGKGRCNITHGGDKNDFFDNVATNPKFLYSAYDNFDNMDTVKFFENKNVPLKLERGDRYFPQSDKSSDIIDALAKSLTKVKVHLNENVESVDYNNGYFSIKTKNAEYSSDYLCIATGGNSYEQTGSDGTGYKLAKNLGHTIIPLKPALCPIKIKTIIDRELELKNVKLLTYINGKLMYDFFGEMTLYKNEINGPIVLTTSSFLNKHLDDKIDIEIDFKPALNYEKLNNRLIRDCQTFAKNDLKTMLETYMLRELIPIFLERLKLLPTMKVNTFTKQNRDDFINLLKHFKLEYLGLSPINFGIVTSGGINVKEIDPKTMQSKIVPNLYFAGEIIDVDALTGGFNLQIAFSTANLVSKDILSKTKKEGNV